ncbi:MAG: PrsW family intramembrane metalloprotease [Paludibacteraceae bacterium]|nr:PrsW family intramembrane metalloprotease [Paludibacteraceae bacterium]
MTYLIAILPIILYLTVVKSLDGYSTTSLSHQIYAFLSGMLACIILMFTKTTLPEWGTAALKLIFIVVLLWQSRIAFLSESAVLGTIIGGGFALTENIAYTYFNNITLHDAETIYLSLSTATIQIGCTAISASLLLIISGRAVGNQNHSRPILLCYILALIIPFALHYTYNIMLGKESLLVVLFVTFLSIMILLQITFWIGEKMVSKWLKQSIAKDVELLNAIEEGKLEETEAGEYFMSLKENFSSEDCFDMLSYLSLSLRLSLMKRKHMILTENNSEYDPDDEEVEFIDSSKKELASLRKKGV